MSWDLEAILDAAGARRGEPALVEVGRTLRGPNSSIGYFWSTGRISATVGNGRVRLKRRLGRMSNSPRGDGFELDTAELRALVITTADWRTRRDSWAAFYYSSAGYPPGYGGACWYRAPGLQDEAIRVGESVLGRRQGHDLVGRDDVVAISLPADRGVDVIAELWRRGEPQGPRDGSLIGLRYALGQTLRVDARREGASVWRDNEDVHLEPGEEDFVAALVDVVRVRGGA